MICLIAAISENRVIGLNGKIPWNIPGEQKSFKKLTMGYPIIMGRNTYQSIGKPLTGRINIVVSSRELELPEGVIKKSSIEEAINEAESMSEKIMVIGGESIYKQTIGIADILYLTVIHKTIEGDTYFPDYSNFKTVIKKEEMNNSSLPYTKLILTR